MADFYCYVENGVIQRYNIAKPKAHGNTAFGANETDEELAKHGYFPIVGEAPAYDPASERLEGPVYAVGEGVVTKSYTVVPIPLDTGKASKLSAANQQCDTRINAITASYPATELLTFGKQEMEARAFLADALAATPLLDALSVNRGVDKAELANRIIAKADAFAAYTGAVVGRRQALEDALAAAKTQADLDAIDPASGWPA